MLYHEMWILSHFHLKHREISSIARIAQTSPSCRRLSERESELVVAEEVRLPGMKTIGVVSDEAGTDRFWKRC